MGGFSYALGLVGGLALFLFGMNVMGEALEKRAGNKMKKILEQLTRNKWTGLLLGLAVTSVIQSSSATTVMVVGFVNSGLMKLSQAISVIMGANIGTTVTAWILSLTGISGSGFFVQMCKPKNFTPILALIGIVLNLFCKDQKKKDTGLILLGFSTLMFGMEMMSNAVAPLAEVESFRNLFLKFSNPILGVLAGAAVSGIIQSSSASVGILQALSATGQITVGSAIPIIMGQNIGTCVTALISSVGTTKNARRAAVVHLYFNIIGTIVMLTLYCAANAIFELPFASMQANQLNIAVVHSTFNLACTALLFPFTKQLERLACLTVPDTKAKDHTELLDERLLATPPVAIARCHDVAVTMANVCAASLESAVKQIETYDAKSCETIRKREDQVDHYEDVIGTYLVKINSRNMTQDDSREATKLLHIIGDFERLSDHAVGVISSVEEMQEKSLAFSAEANADLRKMTDAVLESMHLALRAFEENDLEAAARVEPLEEVFDDLKDKLRAGHIRRVQNGQCTIELGFIFSDLLTNMERVSDHCANIARCVIEIAHDGLSVHEYMRNLTPQQLEQFRSTYDEYRARFAVK